MNDIDGGRHARARSGISHPELPQADAGWLQLLQRLAVERAKTLRGEFLRELWRDVLSWRQRRIALAQLQALDDGALKDIGLHRSGIEAAVLSPRPRRAPVPRRQFPQKPHLWLQRTG